MKRLAITCLVALSVLVFSGRASASTLIENCTTASGSTELNTTISCAQFNIGGQIVSLIQIAVSGGISGTITLTNNGTGSNTGSGTTTSQFSFGAIAGFSYVNPVFSPSFTTGSQTLSPSQTVTVGGLSGTAGGSLGSDSSNFAPYTGAGNFTIPVSTLTGFSILGGGGQFAGSQATTANATATVTFNYSPAGTVPEPAVMSLVGVGLVGLGIAAKARRKARNR